MAMLTAADPDRVVEPIDLTAVNVATIHPSLTRTDCMDSMHVVSRSGRITTGFDGVRSVASWLPLFWPVAAVWYLPGVAWAGRRVYNWLAATRPRDVPCTDDVCGLHSRTAPTVPLARGRVQDHHGPIATLANSEEPHTHEHESEPKQHA